LDHRLDLNRIGAVLGRQSAQTFTHGPLRLCEGDRNVFGLAPEIRKSNVMEHAGQLISFVQFAYQSSKLTLSVNFLVSRKPGGTIGGKSR
jgi:hypothetical protein